MSKFIKQLFITTFAFCAFDANAQVQPAFLQSGGQWADSVMAALTPRERVAQLFMVAAYSNKDAKHVEEISRLVKEQGIGGLIFMQGGPVRQAHLTNKYQQLAKVPLLIAIDGEWGVAMRLDSVPVFPKQMTLGAIANNQLIFDMGKEVARQCSLLGIHVNFAPVVDVNNNPANPVINMRSFGEDKNNVATKGIAYMRGMQESNIMANAKHFPGHGDTDTDSHKALPVIKHPRSRLDTLELYPFSQLIEHGLASTMVAHLFIPSLDATAGIPTTLSDKVVSELLKKQMGFKGLIFTDALNMKGVSNADTPVQVNLKALLAGNDVLLFAHQINASIDAILMAINEGKITQDDIDERVRRILQAKYWTGAYKRSPVQTNQLIQQLNRPEAYELIKQLNTASITVLRNEGNILPLSAAASGKVAVLSFDAPADMAFAQSIKAGIASTLISAKRDELAAKSALWLQQLKSFDRVVVAVHNAGNRMAKSAGMNDGIHQFLAKLRIQNKAVIVVHFANPYALEKLQPSSLPHALVQVYEDTKYSREAAAKAILGQHKPNGKLPVSVKPLFDLNLGMTYASMETEPLIPPVDNKLPMPLIPPERWFAGVDQIALKGIKERAYPGCQIFVMKHGRTVYAKAFGHHTYEQKIPVAADDLYDLASITKIASTTLALMKLYDDGLFDLNKTLGDYLPELKGTNKAGLRIRDVLAHQAGLTPWIPFFKPTIANELSRKNYYSSAASDSFPIQVAEQMWMRADFSDSMYQQLIQSEINPRQGYKYSDLGYYFFQRIIEQTTGKPLNVYVDSVFYKPLGLVSTLYNPLQRFGKEKIVPTEQDFIFRKQLVHGYVHDQGAAMKGGVAGHAGLFSNAAELGRLMQMILNKGEMDGVRYLKASTVEEFIRCAFCEKDNRRGLGFDKPEMRAGKPGPTCHCVSALSFGHTGFTGTMAWADPEEQLVYVFLSNRVHPDAENKKINSLDIRPAIQDEIYRVIKRADFSAFMQKSE